MSKRGRTADGAGELSAAERKTRATFHIDKDLVGDLQELVAKLKRRAREANARMPSMSDIVEDALRAEIAKRSKEL